MKYKVTTADEALQVFDMLGIKNVSTRRQKKNGTQVYELPIQQMYQSLIPKPLRFACYMSGYVRNVSEYNASAYQINKTNDYEVQSSIKKIKQELDENQQKLIKMSFFEQKSHKKIAEELEIPLGTVKSRIRSTLNKMQKILS